MLLLWTTCELSSSIKEKINGNKRATHRGIPVGEKIPPLSPKCNLQIQHLNFLIVSIFKNEANRIILEPAIKIICSFADQCLCTSSPKLLITSVMLPNSESSKINIFPFSFFSTWLGMVEAGDFKHSMFHGQIGSIWYSRQGHMKQKGGPGDSLCWWFSYQLEPLWNYSLHYLLSSLQWPNMHSVGDRRKGSLIG